jgi:SAM-dependent methyltransferase
MKKSATIEVYDQRAAEYAKKTGKQAKKDPELLAFIKACGPNGRVLDLGCGPGTAAAMMAPAGLRVDATDASEGMIRLAAAHKGVTAWQATFDQIEGEDIYDGIWASFSLLHADRADFARHLAALHRALKPGGAFYIGMKLGEGAANDGLGRFYTYYGEDELLRFLAEAGFSQPRRRLGSGTGLDGAAFDWITVTARG